MIRSSLDVHIAILRNIARHGPLKLTHIMRKANVSHRVLRRCLGFMILQNLVMQKVSGKKQVTYTITERGFEVLKCFRRLNAELLRTEEDRKALRALLY